jgi:chemotaxis protein methyltransferase CheR
MILKEALPAGWRAEIVATDLSLEVLEKAKSGMYSQFEVQRGLPIQMLVKYFKQIGDVWQLNPEIRAMVRFQQTNLLQDFSHFGVFDIIFCRNVLIYFDQATKVDVFNRMQRVTEPDGYLFLGAAETVIGLTDAYRAAPDLRGVYMPNPVRSSPSLVPGIGLGATKALARN